MILGKKLNIAEQIELAKTEEKISKIATDKIATEIATDSHQ